MKPAVAVAGTKLWKIWTWSVKFFFLLSENSLSEKRVTPAHKSFHYENVLKLLCRGHFF